MMSNFIIRLFLKSRPSAVFFAIVTKWIYSIYGRLSFAKYLIVTLVCLISFGSIAYATSPFIFTSGQVGANPSNGLCLTTDGTNSTWGSCGSGSGTWPFTTTETNYGVAVQSTTTPEWFHNGLMASSTSYFVNASTTLLTVSNFLYFNGTNPNAGVYGAGNVEVKSGPSSQLVLRTGDDSGSGVGNFLIYGGNGAPGANGGDIYIYGGTKGAGGTRDGDTIIGNPGYVYIQGPGNSVSAKLDATPIVSSSKTFTFPNITGTFALGSYSTGFINGNIPFGSSGLLATSSNLIWDNANSRLGIGTTSPLGTFSVHTGTQDFMINGSQPGYVENNASINGEVGNQIYNKNNGASAYADYNILNDGADGMFFIINGTNRITAPGGANAGQIVQDYNAPLVFLTGGNAAANIRMTIAGTGNIGLGTTTPGYALTIASSTAPQLSLAASAGISQWTLRNAGGNLYFSTTSANGAATSTLAALTISPNGYLGLASTSPGSLLAIGGAGAGWNFVENGTTTSAAKGINLIGGGCYAVSGTCIPGNATSSNYWYANGTSIYNANSGNVGIGTTSPFNLLSVSGDGAQVYIKSTTNNNAQLAIENDLGNTGTMTVLRSGASTPGVMQFYNGGRNFYFNSGNVGIGTTTPQWALNVVKSGAPQITIDSTGNNPWSFRATGGSLYFATSSPTTFATSSMSAFSIDKNGFLTAPALAAASGTNCLQVDTAGKITNTGSACGGAATTTVPYYSNSPVSDAVIAVPVVSGDIIQVWASGINNSGGCVNSSADNAHFNIRPPNYLASTTINLQTVPAVAGDCNVSGVDEEIATTTGTYYFELVDVNHMNSNNRIMAQKFTKSP